ncbi:hypothetical protein R1sor_017465 [Riccia sorocarpa]|uniref:Uncharacterized protein n=1 Tax=Riccia sorocarpa TaxID=122646 RepID=A0ABD3I7A9_9MARC
MGKPHPWARDGEKGWSSAVGGFRKLLREEMEEWEKRRPDKRELEKRVMEERNKAQQQQSREATKRFYKELYTVEEDSEEVQEKRRKLLTLVDRWLSEDN